MQEIYFLTRHIPFWAIPTILIGAELAYLLWLKKQKLYVLMCLFLVLFCFAATLFYVWAGGPEKSVKAIKQIHYSFQ